MPCTLLRPSRPLGLTLSRALTAVIRYELRLMSTRAAGLLARLVPTLCIRLSIVLVLCSFAVAWSLMLNVSLLLARICYELQVLVRLV